MARSTRQHGLTKEQILSSLGPGWVYKTTKTNRYYENTTTHEKLSRRKALDSAIQANPKKYRGKTKYSEVSPRKQHNDETKTKDHWRKATGSKGKQGWKVKEFTSVEAMGRYVEKHPGVYFVTAYGIRPSHYFNTNTGEEVANTTEEKGWVSLTGQTYYRTKGYEYFMGDIEDEETHAQMVSFEKYALYHDTQS